MTTVLTEHGSSQPASASAKGEALWLSAGDVEQTLCWTLKPEGLCQGNTCIPVPKNNAQNYVDGDQVNVAAFWQLMDRPVLHDNAGETWMLGAGHADRGQSLQSRIGLISARHTTNRSSQRMKIR